MRIFRGEISDVESLIIVGPYPTETDFKKLKAAQVKTIISLLDPGLNFERNLLSKEKLLANQYGINFLNFPMTSIFGYSIGQDYNKNANAAADAISSMTGKTYIHCYLGVHRVKVVKDILERKKYVVGVYTMRKAERDQSALLLDQAEYSYEHGQYAKAKRILSNIAIQNNSSQMLDAWSSYHLNDIPDARKIFANANTSKDKDLGLAYCDLRENKLPDSWLRFASILATNPLNEAALSGAGLVLYRQGKLKESADFLKRALEINPEDSDAADTLKNIDQLQREAN